MQEQESTQTIPQLVDEVRTGKLSRRCLMLRLAALGLTAAAVSTVAGAAASTPERASAPTVHPSQEQEQNIHLHERHLAHQQQGDVDSLHSDYAEHAVVEDSMYAAPFIGRAAIMARKGVGMAAIPDLQIQVTNRLAHGPQVVVEWTATGTHTGHFPGLAASGRPFSIRGVTVVVRQQGKIVREAIYYDMQEVRRQLG